MQTGEDAQRGEEREAEGDPEQHVLGAGPAAGDQADAEDQHAQVGDDASELGGGAIVALRPDEGEAGPDGEAEEEADDVEAGRVRPGTGRASTETPSSTIHQTAMPTWSRGIGS